jgi:hypothetical protein
LTSPAFTIAKSAGLDNWQAAMGASQGRTGRCASLLRAFNAAGRPRTRRRFLIG